MLGCWSRAASLISRRNRSRPRATAISGRSVFRATNRSCFTSRARYTSAMPPRPSSLSMTLRADSAGFNSANGSVTRITIVPAYLVGERARQRCEIGDGPAPIDRDDDAPGPRGDRDHLDAHRIALSCHRVDPTVNRHPPVRWLPLPPLAPHVLRHRAQRCLRLQLLRDFSTKTHTKRLESGDEDVERREL